MATNFAALEQLHGIEIEYDYNKIVAQLEHYNSLLDKDLPGMEGLISNILGGIVQILFKVINNFKTVLFKFYKNVKRSELKAFHESYFIDVWKAKKIEYTDASKLNVPIPKGMSKPYPMTLAEIVDIHKMINMILRIDQMVNTISEVTVNLKASQPIKVVVNNGLSSADGNLRNKVLTRLKKLMDNSERTLDSPFGKQFKSMAEFNSFIDEVLKLAELYYTEIGKVTSQLGKIETMIQSVIDDKDLQSKLDKQEIRSLGDLTHIYASTFDVYGSTIHTFARLEHNTVEVLKVLMGRASSKSKNI